MNEIHFWKNKGQDFQRLPGLHKLGCKKLDLNDSVEVECCKLDRGA